MNSQPAELVPDDLPPPRIRENLVSGLLNSVEVRYSCRVVMEYPIEPGDRVCVTWAGAPGAGSYTSALFSVDGLRPLEVGIGGALLVIFNQGMTVALSYTVIRGTSEPVTSQPLILYVLPVRQNDLPRPLITQAPDFGEGLVLDVRALTEFTLRINSWALQTRDQYFWLRLRGVNADGSDFNEVYWRPPGNVVGQSFSKGFYAQNYSAVSLKGLMDRSTLTLEFKAGLQGSQDEAVAQRFAHRNYIVRTTASITPEPPKILSVKNPLGQDIADGGNTKYSTVTVHGNAKAEEVEIYNGEIYQGTANVVAGSWQHQVTGLIDGPHVLTAIVVDGDGEKSNRWTINVELQDRPLSIKEAFDNLNLEPLAATDSLTAVVDDLEVGDSVTVTWTAAAGTPSAGTHTTNPVIAGATRPLEIPLPVPLVAFSVDKRAEVTFTYTRGASLPVTSQPFPLNVLAIPSTALTAPVITQANGTDELDLKDVKEGATLKFGGWPHIAYRQRIWLDLEGENASGGSENRSMWMGARNSVHQNWVTTNGHSIAIAYSYLRLLAVGSKLFIRFRVNLDQVPDPATEMVFDVREYIVRSTA